MSLKEEIKILSGNRRKFLLLRITDMEPAIAMAVVGIKRGTYNTWLQDENFVTLYRRREEFALDYKQEAIQLLRRDNQLEAALLETKILEKMKAELESGEYNLIRSQLARDVYAKLTSELDAAPKTQILSWEQKIAQFMNPVPANQLQQGVIIDAEQSKEISSSQEEPSEGELVSEGEQGAEQVLEEPQKQGNIDE